MTPPVTVGEAQIVAALLAAVAEGDPCACLRAAERAVADVDVPLTPVEHLLVVEVVEIALAAACAALLREVASELA